jgi:hypothetical protein
LTASSYNVAGKFRSSIATGRLLSGIVNIVGRKYCGEVGQSRRALYKKKPQENFVKLSCRIVYCVFYFNKIMEEDNKVVYKWESEV